MEVKGKYIIIYVHKNKYFDNLVLFVKEHFDKEEYKNSVIVIEDFVYHPVQYYRDLFPNRNIIFYNWEQMVSNNTYFNIDKIIENVKGVDELWDYDHLNVEYFKWHNIKVDKVVPIKYTESIKCIQNNEDPSIDILIFGYMNDVRLNKLKKVYPSLYHNYSIMSISGFDRKEQEKYIADAKIVLNIHGIEPYCRQEQERIGFSLINSKCVLSEKSQLNYFGSCIVESDLNNISEIAKHILDNNLWKEIAKSGHDNFKRGTYKLIQNEV